jgi:hypothetical protein
MYNDYFEEMKNDTESGFFLVISSINMTHSLICNFYLNKDDVANTHKKSRANRKQFKIFTRLN